MTHKLPLKSRQDQELIDITHEVQELVTTSGVKEGLCVIYVPHTTGAVTINENADPDVKRDILMALNKIVSFKDPAYRHFEGNSAAHIKSSMMGFSETVIISEGRLLLGTWQGIYFTEFDGPRNRKVMIKIIND